MVNGKVRCSIIIFSLSSTSSLLHWLRIVQVLLLYLYVLDSKLATNKILTPLAMGIIFSAILSLAQVLTGRNIGGLLYWFGERPLNINQPGVALLSLSGISLLRPYATFPHPNALAGYAGLLFLFTLPYFSKNLIIKLSSLASFLIVVISYSQSAWLALFFSLIVMKKHKFSLHLLFTVFSVFSLLTPLFIYAVDLRSFTLPLFISQRLELSQTAGEVIATYPLFGTGLGQFIRTIPAFTSQNIWWLQPVHNLPLLFTAELGLLGLVTLYILTKKYLSTLTINYYPLIIFVLVTAFVDHYWLTAHQNLLLIPILFGTIKTHDLIHK